MNFENVPLTWENSSLPKQKKKNEKIILDNL